MLMNLMAAGCFVVVVGVMIAMWRFDAKQKDETNMNHKGNAQSGKGRV